MKNQVKFQFQKSIWYFKPPIKNYRQISKRGWKEHFFNIFKYPLWNLSITFDWSLEISNGFLEMKFNFIFKLFPVQSFLKKVILLWLNEIWNSTSNKIFTFSQWAVSLIFKLSHTLWGFMVDNWFQYKMTSSTSSPTNVF